MSQLYKNYNTRLSNTFKNKYLFFEVMWLRRKDCFERIAKVLMCLPPHRRQDAGPRWK